MHCYYSLYGFCLDLVQDFLSVDLHKEKQKTRTVSRNDSILSVLPVHTVGIGRLKDGEQE